jgi:hypothetical protein
MLGTGSMRNITAFDVIGFTQLSPILAIYDNIIKHTRE